MRWRLDTWSFPTGHLPSGLTLGMQCPDGVGCSRRLAGAGFTSEACHGYTSTRPPETGRPAATPSWVAGAGAGPWPFAPISQSFPGTPAGGIASGRGWREGSKGGGILQTPREEEGCR